MKEKEKEIENYRDYIIGNIDLVLFQAYLHKEKNLERIDFAHIILIDANLNDIIDRMKKSKEELIECVDVDILEKSAKLLNDSISYIEYLLNHVSGQTTEILRHIPKNEIDREHEFRINILTLRDLKNN